MHGGPSTPDSSMSPSTVGVRGHFFPWVKHCTDGAWHDAAKNANKSKEPKTKKILKKMPNIFFALSLKMPKYQPHLLQFRFGVRNKLLNVRKHAPVFEIPLDEPFRGKRPSQ